MMPFYIIISILGDIAITCFCGIWNSWADIWKPLLIFPALLIGLILIHVLAFLLFSLTADKKKDVTDIHNAHRAFMLLSLKTYFQLMRVRIHVEGKELVPDDGKYLLVGNHISICDPIITLLALQDKNLAFVSKVENFDIPFIGRYIKKAGCLGIDRENTRAAVKTINEAAKRITDGISGMGIYPEGWVNTTARGLKEFRNGAFKIAKKAHVPIVVAVTENTRKIIDDIFIKSVDAHIKILKVIPYEEIAHLKTVEIGEMVRDIMLTQLKKDNLA